MKKILRVLCITFMYIGSIRSMETEPMDIIPQNHFDWLPKDVVVLVLCHFPNDTLLQCCKVFRETCKRFNELYKTQFINHDRGIDAFAHYINTMCERTCLNVHNKMQEFFKEHQKGFFALYASDQWLDAEMIYKNKEEETQLEAIVICVTTIQKIMDSNKENGLYLRKKINDKLHESFRQFNVPVDSIAKGGTFLHRAAERNLVKPIELLLASGANINILNRDGKTPLQVAITHNAADAAKLLTERGAGRNM